MQRRDTEKRFSCEGEARAVWPAREEITELLNCVVQLSFDVDSLQVLLMGVYILARPVLTNTNLFVISVVVCHTETFRALVWHTVSEQVCHTNRVAKINNRGIILVCHTKIKNKKMRRGGCSGGDPPPGRGGPA